MLRVHLHAQVDNDNQGNESMKLRMKSWFLIVVVITMCMSTIGGTVAWFTDEVTSTANIVTSGNLKAGMQWTDGKQNPASADWQDASEGTIFEYTRWEPGVVQVRHLHVKNEGSLAFKYRLNIRAGADVTALADVIDVYCITPARQIVSRSDLANYTRVGTLSEVLSGMYVSDGGALLPGGEATVTIALKMREEAGNEYQGMNLGPDFSVQLVATQYAYEQDSFGSSYDAEAVFPAFSGRFAAAADVTGKVSGNRLNQEVMIGSPADGMYAIVPEGTLLEPGTTRLVLKVDTVRRSGDIEMTMGQVSRSLDVHIEGIADRNTVPVTVDLGPVMPVGLKDVHIQLYHVEDGEPKRMKAVDILMGHNQFIYDAATGDTAVMMATFSEVTAVVTDGDPWDGKTRDYSWYNTTDSEFTLTTEEQFAGFAAIVGGMADGIAQDGFAGKTVRLGENLDLGGKNGTVWYPVGYYNNTGSYTKKSGGSVTSDLSPFEGVFDGQGYTIANVYQNTWEMFGDYNSGYAGTPNHYKDGMGIFGFVFNGTVRSLNVVNFQSDGEFGTTGCVAAYASGYSTFENITVRSSNPRAYNVPNGGVVGYAYDEDGYTNVINFKNVEVDNTTKVSALWGSWDVGCGGILGRVNGNTTINMDDCTVAAVIDVFNDVCGNYQYYQYRYSGMLIGTVGSDGDPKSGPEKVSFSNVEVYIGSWANYYFCEFEKNSQGSYTDDFQFSRVEKHDIVFNDKTNMPKGCTHEHQGSEDKLAVYLPFSQIYTGYGWGAEPVYSADGVTVTKQFYTITYMDATGSTVLAKEYATSGERSEAKLWADAYTVRTGAFSQAAAGQLFNGWVNAGSVKTTVIPAGNRIDVVLYESWDNPYTARFVDQFGNVIYSQTFTKSNPTVSVPQVPPVQDYIGVWEDYDLSKATGDITIRPIYTYGGKLKLTPVDDPEDGVIDYYKVEAVSELDETTYIPGYFNGLPVKVVEKLYKNDNNWDFGSGVKKVIIGEGVEELKHNSLAYTSDLDTVKLPSTIVKLEKNTFSRNSILGGDKKVLTIEYNGTMADWDRVVDNSVSNWHGGLKEGSVVKCSDGYFELSISWGQYTWRKKSY